MLFLLENMELIKLIKRKSINSFSKPNLNLQKYRWLEKPLVKKTLVSSTFAGCFVMGIIHFIEDDITQQRPRRRGGLIAFSYNYRIGVMFWEIVTTVFSIFPIFILACYSYISLIIFSRVRYR